ncbi:CLUMA_CG006154, isoform A [Clunio marinus]|uniref:CLUMA_CG006154, isoform A n=1 Tax=Clunio marinus TaxID=568069 RepID=A0A1J1HYG6_9DIPT|nr:CLUMA_CG006154, isoform A [Clunio marinus]
MRMEFLCKNRIEDKSKEAESGQIFCFLTNSLSEARSRVEKEFKRGRVPTQQVNINLFVYIWNCFQLKNHHVHCIVPLRTEIILVGSKKLEGKRQKEEKYFRENQNIYANESVHVDAFYGALVSYSDNTKLSQQLFSYLQLADDLNFINIRK